ncbi:phosphotransferase family protein [Actinoplanes awajinensis]|uniref:Aminoglycoside phosphotransferase n=1 Tax=Actinoplanes awajinensis subsp. mycoplanecinus TaxID=135947 RepID=A0A101JU40_9ACTN|nr:aminoglycoside phosphotransferase family protein [Actinoplanes awajinensis]KUL32748.1 aminoglycoside phosphotransferase [Actinoplanes awajinensis subsp. mycoplanecinus]
MPRTVTLVLVDPAGDLLGALPPFTVLGPWWQEVAEVVAGAGVEVTVLRLLHADREAPPGGHVTYLAETPDRPAGLTPLGADLVPHARRAPWAEPGGPSASLAWAAGALDRLGFPGATARQQRTWNLSAIWRLDGPDGGPVAWLKQVPEFFAHEPAVLGLVAEVAPELVPYLLAAGQAGRMLLAHVPGDDRYGAGPRLCAEIAEMFHPVQAHYATRTDRLLTAGVPDRRLTHSASPAAASPAGRLPADTVPGDAALPTRGLDAARFARVAAPYRDDIPGLAELIDGLPERLAAVAACGLPDTLLHGDLHPGNVRTDGEAGLVIIDWGDSGVGHPAFDLLRLTDGLDNPEPLVAAWAQRWRETAPGCEPERAVELLRPVAGLLGAVTYAGFLAHIEQSEWPYHAGDVPERLTAAVAAVGPAPSPVPGSVRPAAPAHH